MPSKTRPSRSHTTASMLALALAGLASCASDPSVCELAIDHARECGLEVESPETCTAEAAAAADKVLASNCPGPGDSKSDNGEKNFTDWDDFQCTIRTQYNSGLLKGVFDIDNCACRTVWDFPAPRDYSDDEGVISGRVLDAVTREPVQLEPGQWLALKTATVDYNIDTQLRGVRADAQGNFVIEDLMCDPTDLRVYVEDANTVPKRRHVTDWKAENNFPLATTIEGVAPSPSSERPGMFMLSEARPPITVLVTLGVSRAP